MNQTSFSTAFSVDQSPERVFSAINHARGWWSGSFEGETNRLGAEFNYRYRDAHYSRERVTEFIPAKKIVWHVTDSNLTFVDRKQEWTGTDIIFEISKKGGRTELRFTHAGLVPDFQCFDACSNAWSTLVSRNLQNLIITGEDQPDIFA